MSFFDGLRIANQGMNVARLRTEVAAENLSQAYNPNGAGGYKVVDLQPGSFDTALKTAEANGSITAGINTGGGDAVNGGVRVAGIHTIPQPGGGERVAALLGAAEMMQAKSAFELNARVAGMMKSMAMASLEIGRGQ
jgi:flagellar basal body rod protein FlgC